jgi:hypothetical protein
MGPIGLMGYTQSYRSHRSYRSYKSYKSYKSYLKTALLTHPLAPITLAIEPLI